METYFIRSLFTLSVLVIIDENSDTAKYYLNIFYLLK